MSHLFFFVLGKLDCELLPLELFSGRHIHKSRGRKLLYKHIPVVRGSVSDLTIHMLATVLILGDAWSCAIDDIYRQRSEIEALNVNYYAQGRNRSVYSTCFRFYWPAGQQKKIQFYSRMHLFHNQTANSWRVFFSTLKQCFPKWVILDYRATTMGWVFSLPDAAPNLKPKWATLPPLSSGVLDWWEEVVIT